MPSNTPLTDALYQPRIDSFAIVPPEKAYQHACRMESDRAALIEAQIQGCETLDDVAQSLRFESSPFADWIVYEGGNHVALHRFDGALRTAIITLR